MFRCLLYYEMGIRCCLAVSVVCSGALQVPRLLDHICLYGGCTPSVVLPFRTVLHPQESHPTISPYTQSTVYPALT
jgi:hypothetical protein